MSESASQEPGVEKDKMPLSRRLKRMLNDAAANGVDVDAVAAEAESQRDEEEQGYQTRLAEGLATQQERFDKFGPAAQEGAARAREALEDVADRKAKEARARFRIVGGAEGPRADGQDTENVVQ